MKTSEATPLQLNYLAAKCENYPVKLSKTGFLVFSDPLIQCGPRGSAYSPSTNWAQGGPIIEEQRINLYRDSGAWSADAPDGKESSGPTPLVAAMRCFVSSRLGDEVEIPEELL